MSWYDFKKLSSYILSAILLYWAFSFENEVAKVIALSSIVVLLWKE
jgi:hypothetical protein